LAAAVPPLQASEGLHTVDPDGEADSCEVGHKASAQDQTEIGRLTLIFHPG
jgi:hypothetical protein